MLDCLEVLQARPILETHTSHDDRSEQQTRHEPQHRSEHRCNPDGDPRSTASTFQTIAGKDVGHDVATVEWNDGNEVEGAPTERREESNPEQVLYEQGLFDNPSGSNPQDDGAEHDSGEWTGKADEDRLTSTRHLIESVAGPVSYTHLTLPTIYSV